MIAEAADVREMFVPESTAQEKRSSKQACRLSVYMDIVETFYVSLLILLCSTVFPRFYHQLRSMCKGTDAIHTSMFEAKCSTLGKC